MKKAKRLDRVADEQRSLICFLGSFTGRKRTETKHVAKANGTLPARQVLVNIHAKLGKRGRKLVNFIRVCPTQCLEVAADLTRNGWQVTLMEAWYKPVHGYSLWQEADPMFGPATDKGTNGLISECIELTCSSCT